MTTLIVSFRNSEKAPKNYLHHNVDKPSKEIVEGCKQLRDCMLEQILHFTGNCKEEDEIIGSCIPGNKFRENREVEIFVTR